MTTTVCSNYPPSSQTSAHVGLYDMCLRPSASAQIWHHVAELRSFLLNRNIGVHAQNPVALDQGLSFNSHSPLQNVGDSPEHGLRYQNPASRLDPDRLGSGVSEAHCRRIAVPRLGNGYFRYSASALHMSPAQPCQWCLGKS